MSSGCAESSGPNAGTCDPVECATRCGPAGGSCVAGRCSCGDAGIDAPTDDGVDEDADADDAADAVDGDAPPEDYSCTPTAPADTTCNRLDDDCDGATDEDYEPTTCGLGECTRLSVCAMGIERCNPAAGRPEGCNGLDDDCDGETDDGFPCAAGAVEACPTPCGSTGTQTCSASTCTWGACVAPAETCNGQDDDCVDGCDDTFACCRDATVSCTTSCGSTGTGACTATCQIPGTTICSPPAETCNGQDDDCDDLIDEVGAGFACGDGCCNGAENPCTCPTDCSAGAVLTPPRPLVPFNGTLTGSIHAPPGAAVRRPRFRWTAATGGCGAATYEIQIDNSCATPGFAACAFPSPETGATGLTSLEWRPPADLDVSATAPVGRRYYWRVRACEDGLGCTTWSAVRYVDVARSPGDFNGDGYSDAVVGAHQAAAPAVREGNAFVFMGSATGVAAAPAVTLDNPANDSYAYFGFAVALAGDVNADGFADLVVGAHRQSAGATYEGNAFVYHGGVAGIDRSPSRVLDNPLNDASGYFGYSVASAGDVNADGFADVVIGASRQDLPGLPTSSEGAAYLFHGSAAGLPAAPATAIGNPFPQSSAGFGHAVGGAGDVNGDGFADVVVGAPNQDAGATNEGNAFVFMGSATGVAVPPAVTMDNPTNDAGAYLGRSVGGGDFDADGYADVVVGAPYQTSGASSEGNVFMYRGGPTGPPAVPSVAMDNPANDPGGHFGASVAAGDFNGDGGDDLLVGAPEQTAGATNEGNAFVFYGGAPVPGGLRMMPDRTIDNPTNQSYGAFGVSVAHGGDFNGDGFGDAIIGADQQDGTVIDEGAAFVYHGSAGGLPVAPTRRLSNPVPVTDTYFGTSVAAGPRHVEKVLPPARRRRDLPEAHRGLVAEEAG
ncbi:MAG: VCBS repeat-containing protein [Myxococcota bacterium]|nr:VCBS repeat-containing protein [Myxococcota bacterium]